MSDAVEDFIQFAGEKLDNHILELSTEYNRAPLSAGLVNEAYAAHKKILSRELDEQINKLAIPGNPWIEAKLRLIKEDYETKLQLNENEALVNQKIRNYL